MDSTLWILPSFVLSPKSNLMKHRSLQIGGGFALVAIAGFVTLPGETRADPREMPAPHTAANPGAYMKALRNEAMRDALGKGAAGNLPGQPTGATQPTGEPEAREVPTNASMQEAFRRAQQDNPMRNPPPEAEAEDVKVNPPVDLIASSDILCHRGKATLVPKRAILHRPGNLEGRLALVKDSQILTWADFYKLNRDWIKTIEVTRAQAEGVEPLAEESYEMLEQSKILVIATYKGGPISVLPLKVPAPEGSNATEP